MKRKRDRLRRDCGPTFVLVPCAETDFARQGRLAGDVDVPLSPNGRGRSRRLVDEVLLPMGGVDAVYTSVDQGSRETAEILARADSMQVRVHPDLRGMSFGVWEGQLATDIRQRHPKIWEQWVRDPFTITPPGGEAMGLARVRAERVVRSIRKKHRRDTVLLVAPETVVALVYCHLRGVPFEQVYTVGRSLRPVEVIRSEPAPD